ncbi:MAG: hypothetical protein GY861_14665 [bacterium]|nr:hypothetical protein [bacterium]
MSRPFYTYYKRGNLKYKHLQMVHLYDPEMWGHTEAQEKAHFGDFMHQVYFIVRHNRDEMPKYLSYLTEQGKLLPSGDVDVKESSYLPSTHMIDDSVFDISLKEKLVDGSHIPIFDNTDKATITKKITLAEGFDDVHDIHAVTGGSYTHGTAGDYADLVAADADMGNAVTNYTLTQISDETLVAKAYFSLSWGTSLTHLFTSDSDPDGDPTAGWEIIVNLADHAIQMAGSGSGNTITWQDFNMRRITAGDNTKAIFRTHSLSSTEGVCILKNMFIDGGGYKTEGFDGYRSNTQLLNIAVRDCAAADTTTGSGFHLQDTSSDGPILMDNCASEGNVVGADCHGQSGLTLVNCAFFDNTTDVANQGSADADFCLSEDATAANGNWSTGTNCITGITPVTEYELDDTSSDYLAVQADAVSADTSTTDPGQDLMDGSWTNEIGPKIQLEGAGGPPLGSLSMMGVGR